MKGLTLNEEPNVGHPYACGDSYNEPIPVPYGDASNIRKRLTAASPHCRGGRTCGAQSRTTRRQRPSTQRSEMKRRQKQAPTDVHSSDRAQRGRGGANLRIGRYSGPKNVARRNMGAHGIDNGHNVPRNCIGLSSQYPPG